MFVIRNVFKCKPGRATFVIDKLQHSMALPGMGSHRILVDHIAEFWTVVLETEVENMAEFEDQLRRYGERTDVREAMSGYLDGVESGYREVFRVVGK